MKVLAAVMQRLRAEPPARPAKAVKTPAERTTSHISVDHLKTPSILKHSNMKTFTRSPLATSVALTAAEVDALDLVFTHSEVQRAAGRLHLKRQRLLEAAGFRSAIAEGIAAVGGPMSSITPEQVIAALEQASREVDDEIDCVREDRAQHDARHKGRLQRLAPLSNAVSVRATALTNERETCIRHIDAGRRAATMTAGAANLRYANLVAAGLTREQINALGPSAQPSEVQEAKLKDRVAAIGDDLALLLAFQADERDVTPLVGLGFDALIDARNAAEQIPA